MNSISPHKDTCPYSVFSLQFYSVLALIKLGQFLNLPNPLKYLLALVGPKWLLNRLIKFIVSRGDFKLINITLLDHGQQQQQPQQHRQRKKMQHSHSTKDNLFVILISFILGILLSLGISFIIPSNNDSFLASNHQPHLVPLGAYLILLSFFHFSEFFVTSLTNPSTLNLSSFLIDQSTAYTLAISSSLLEFLTESYYMPHLKKFHIYISSFGLILAIFGESIRKCAMFTAGRNFSHTISFEKCPEHQLITHGVYSIFRHPSYAGWFYWAIGTQIMLLNPICTIMFAVISIKFFKERIDYEEEKLIEFFKQDYVDYKKRVKLWLPL